MAYQVLSLKWRPQTFKEVVGQEHVTHTLTNAEKDKKTLSRGFTSLGRGNFINGALLNAQAGELLGPIKTSRGYTLMKVLEVQEFDSTTYVVQKDGLRTTLQSQKRNAAYGDWLNAKTEEAEIVDNRKFHGYN